MRLRISHLTSYHYEAPATSISQMLRLTPRNNESQYVVHWRIDVSNDCWLHQHEDAFGNITHAFTAEGSFRELAVMAEGRSRDAGYSGHPARHHRAVPAEPLPARYGIDERGYEYRRFCGRLSRHNRSAELSRYLPLRQLRGYKSEPSSPGGTSA
jgi:transglutaminase-like putative cysteine protease